MNKILANRRGVTLLELLVTMAIASIVMLGASAIIVDAHYGWSTMYQRIHGDVMSDAYFASTRFDAMCRKADGGTVRIETAPPLLEVYYYSVPNVGNVYDLSPDLFVQFYLNGTELIQDIGDIATSTVTSSEVIASDVTELKFSASGGKGVQMLLTLNNGEESITVTCGSIRHN
jgi:prepilin-type N-terminal cleavage/methylation domain-containing protein